MIEVTSEHFLALVEAHMRFLEGNPAALSLGPLGPLASLLVERDQWRPDGALRTHRVLGRALDALVGAHDAGTFVRTFRSIGGTAVTIRTMRSALRARWGLDCAPTRGNVTPPGGPSITAKTLHEWESEVAGSGPSLAAAAEWLTENTEPGIPLGRPRDAFRPVWSVHAAQCPPTEQRAAFVSAAIVAGVPGDEVEVLQTLRHAASRAVLTYLTGNRNRTAILYHFAATRPYWFGSDARFVDEVVDHLAEHGRAPSAIQAETRERIVLAHLMGLLVSDRAAELRPVWLARQAVAHHLAPDDPRPRIAMVREPERHAFAGVDLSTSPVAERLWEAATKVRAAQGPARIGEARAYVELRREIHEHLGAYTEWLQRSVAAADQSVGHDVMALGDAKLLWELNELRNASPRTPVFASNRVFALRDRAQLVAKRGDLEPSLRLTETAFKGVLEMEALDARTRLETLEQVVLARAGNHARMLEAMVLTFTRQPRRVWGPTVYQQHVVAAERCADEAVALIGELAPDLVDASDGRRFVDGYISTAQWTVQPKIIAVRIRATSLVLRGLLGQRSRATAPLRQKLVEAYIDLLMDRRLTATQAPELVQNAILTACLNRRELPIVTLPSDPDDPLGPDSRVPAVYLAAPFLTLAPPETGGLPPSTTTIGDHELKRARHMLSRRVFDRGPLAEMLPDSPAARFLDRESDGLWSRWMSDGEARPANAGW